MAASQQLGDGAAKAQGRGMGEGPSLAITTMFFFWKLPMYFGFLSR